MTRQNPRRLTTVAGRYADFRPVEPLGSQVELDQDDIRKALGAKRGYRIPWTHPGWRHSVHPDGLALTKGITFTVSFDNDGSLMPWDGGEVSSFMPRIGAWHYHVSPEVVATLVRAAQQYERTHR